MVDEPTFSTEHDDEVLSALAFVYLCCAKSSDDELAPEEIERIHDKLFVRLIELHLDDEHPRSTATLRERSREITAGAADAYRAAIRGATVVDRLDDRARSLRERLPPAALERILLDLIDLCEADGKVSAGESAFVQAAARTFDLALTVAGGPARPRKESP